MQIQFFPCLMTSSQNDGTDSRDFNKTGSLSSENSNGWVEVMAESDPKSFYNATAHVFLVSHSQCKDVVCVCFCPDSLPRNKSGRKEATHRSSGVVMSDPR